VSYACYCEVDEAYEVIDEKELHARKPWVCEECQGPIPVGALYLRSKGLIYGTWTTHRTCAGCLVPFRWVEEHCGCWLYGDLERHLHEDVFQEADLPPGVKFKVGRWLVEMSRRRGQRWVNQ